MSILTAKEFQRALSITPRGREIVYHNGSLMRDRELDAEVEALARVVLKAYEDGDVLLYQRRTHYDACDYIAVPITPRGPQHWRGCYDPKKDGAIQYSGKRRVNVRDTHERNAV